MSDQDIRDEVENLKMKLSELEVLLEKNFSRDIKIEARVNGQSARIEELEEVKEAFSRLVKSFTK